MSQLKSCVVCGSGFVPYTCQQLYCGDVCSRKAASKRYGMVSIGSEYGINKNKVGALNELKVCADLIMRGWEVYRSVAPSNKFDLIAYKNGSLLKVEVKTAYHRNNKLYYAMGATQTEHDVLAAVTVNGIYYTPDIL